MGTPPQGWQTPKTNWQAANAPVAPDFNRIEGNIEAIELGTRTLDPSQAPSGNTGTLRQFLDWFANRIKAITGGTNWWDNPATTLAAAKQHIDATTGIHGATSSATADRIILRDSAGRAQVADPAAAADIATKNYVDSHASAVTNVHGVGSYRVAKTSRSDQWPSWWDLPDKPGNLAQTPVPVTALKKATGSFNTSETQGYVVFVVNQYALASPLISHPTGGGYSVIEAIGYVAASQSNVRQWRMAPSSASGTKTVTWDYLTASGRPRIWAVVDDAGRIISMWESEDPADLEDPDACPIGLVDANGNSIIPTGGAVVRLQAPKPEQLAVVMDRLQRAPLPSRYPWHLTASTPPDVVPRLHRGLFRKALQERGLEEPPDIRDAYSIRNPHRRDWYLQLWLRNASRVLHDHKAHTLIPLYQDMFRVDKRTGRLELA